MKIIICVENTLTSHSDLVKKQIITFFHLIKICVLFVCLDTTVSYFILIILWYANWHNMVCKVLEIDRYNRTKSITVVPKTHEID